MALTEWDNKYELGIQEIDDHHRELVELLNKTYDLILYSTENDDMQKILLKLTMYTEYHFATEEQMMKDAGFTGLKTHKSKHGNFKKQLALLMQDHLSAAPHVNTDIVLFLWDWLHKHILKYDKKFIASLSQK